MTVDELIEVLEDTKRLDPTIGGWAVRVEVAVKYQDDAYYEASLYDEATICVGIGTVMRSNGTHVKTPAIIARPEAS